MPFMSFFNSTPPSLTVKATAAAVFQGEYCMVALEDGGYGVTFTGSAGSTSMRRGQQFEGRKGG
jgi:hypothetical protein